VDEHLPGCAACRRELEQLRALHVALQKPELRYAASDTLRQRLQNELHREAARPPRGRWLSMGAAAAIVVAVAVAVTVSMHQHGTGAADDDAMVDAAVDQQQQAFKTNHLIDLTSAHPSAIQNWFSHNLAFTPPVPLLSAQGFDLVGARVDQVKNEPAAVLVYRHGVDYVSVYVCPAQHGDTPIDTDSDDGYQVVYWTKGRLSFWVVSKLDAASLKRLGESLRQNS
jgi:anti-sigma factor RsiW